VAFDLVEDGGQEVSVAPGSYVTLGSVRVVEVWPRASVSLSDFSVDLQ
jgi:hypothetical protein